MIIKTFHSYGIISVLTCLFFLSVAANAEESRKVDMDTHVWLTGKIKNSVTKYELPEATVVTFNEDGSVRDSLPTKLKSYAFINGEVEEREMSYIQIPVLRKDSTYKFEVVCPGFETKRVSYTLKKPGKRVQRVEMPVIFLDKEARRLDELTVTASKVKFYHKGDTIVYNADAFQLAEGSMLDALIAQLPGVELNSDGQIKVNGEFVESLLLNGKEFFDGDNNLMLENIGAYMVKDVQVYKGQTLAEKWAGDDSKKRLTMDVRLKRDYNRGIIVNATGGYGTEDRYIGRLFVSMFTSTTNLALIGNFNNLNYNRDPGKNDSWSPESMPSGTRQYNSVAFNYSYRAADESTDIDGYAKFEDSRQNYTSQTSRTNFLSGGDTYDYSFSHNRDRRLRLETKHYYNFFHKKVSWTGQLIGRYNRQTNTGGNTSASFNEEQTAMTMKAIETLYTEVSSESLGAVINRSLTRTDGTSHSGEVKAYPTMTWKLGNSGDTFLTQIGLVYNDSKEERWNDYTINYGSDPNPAVRKRQMTDNSPNRNFSADICNKYTGRWNAFRFGLEHCYEFHRRDKDSYMYALDRLEDMGIFGTLPSGYLDTFDPGNSYTSTLYENRHELLPFVQYQKTLKNGNWIFVDVMPMFALLHQHLDYWRDNRQYIEKSTSFLTKVGKWNGRAIMQLKQYKDEDNKGMNYAHILEFNYGLDTKTPDLTHKIDIVNDSDPLNIMLGNPELKNSHIHTFNFTYTYSARRNFYNTLSIEERLEKDALVRGYTYVRNTGVRYNRTYNVNGNRSWGVNDYVHWTFGTKDQFELSAGTGLSSTRYANMIGENVEIPVKSMVDNLTFNQDLSLSWKFGRQEITATGKFTNRHTTSDRKDFNVIDAHHFTTGMRGVFKLPAGFGLSTDFMVYARRGYGEKELDTTDAIWNMRLSYAPKGKSWVFNLDGFDLLHQLSNVSYAVNDQARVVTLSNSLPRYLLFTVQYRFNKNPKKK